MKRPNDRGDRDAGKLEIESHGFQVECFSRLPYSTVHLRDQCAQRPKPIAPGDPARRIADQQSQIRLETAIYRLMQRQRQWGGRRDPGRNAALELAPLTEERGLGQTDQENDAFDCEAHGGVSPWFSLYRGETV